LKTILGHENTNRPEQVRKSWHNYVSDIATEIERIGGQRRATQSQLIEFLRQVFLNPFLI